MRRLVLFVTLSTAGCDNSGGGGEGGGETGVIDASPSPAPPASDAAWSTPPVDSIRVSDEGSDVSCPAITTSPDGLIVAWKDATRNVIASNAVAADGQRVGPDQVVASAVNSVPEGVGVACPAFATGEPPGTHRLAWSTDDGVYTQLLDASGAAIGSPVRAFATDEAVGVSLAFDGEGYGLVWDAGHGVEDPFEADFFISREIDFIRLDDAGEPTSEVTVLVPRRKRVEGPAIIAHAGGFVVTWSDVRVHVARVGADGGELTEAGSYAGDGISDGYFPPARLVTVGSGAAVAWGHRAWNEYNARALVLDETLGLASDAEPYAILTGTPRSIAVAASPSSVLHAWTQRSAWASLKVELPPVVQYARVGLDGAILPPLQHIPGDVDWVAAAFDGTHFVLAMGAADGGLYLRSIDP